MTAVKKDNPPTNKPDLWKELAELADLADEAKKNAQEAQDKTRLVEMQLADLSMKLNMLRRRVG